jgi:hypothetical protein
LLLAVAAAAACGRSDDPTTTGVPDESAAAGPLYDRCNWYYEFGGSFVYPYRSSSDPQLASVSWSGARPTGLINARWHRPLCWLNADGVYTCRESRGPWTSITAGTEWKVIARDSVDRIEVDMTLNGGRIRCSL